MAFSDADWAGNVDTRTSMLSTIIKQAGAAVAWRMTNSKLVCLNTAESETDAAVQTCKLAIFCRDVTRQLRCPPAQWTANFTPARLRVFVDNQAAIAILSSFSRGRNRHMDIRLKFLKQKLALGDFDFVYVASTDNEADIGTKCLHRDILLSLSTSVLGNGSTDCRARGSIKE